MQNFNEVFFYFTVIATPTFIAFLINKLKNADEKYSKK